MTFKTTEYFKKMAIFAVITVLVAGSIYPLGIEKLKNSEAVYYFSAAYAPKIEILAANRKVLKGTSSQNQNVFWISEKPDNFENRFLFNISCFTMSTVLTAELVSVKAPESKISCLKKMFHIRI